MEARIKINLTEGVFEVEGSEKFVVEIYEGFKKELINTEKKQNLLPKFSKKQIIDSSKKDTQTKKKRKSSTSKRKPTLVKDLDLMGGKKGLSLKSFVEKYEPLKSGMEWNTLFVYYLEKILEIKDIGVDHIYTCYKDINQKSPSSIYQNLIDTARNKATINTSSIDDIKITVQGENFVEHEIPERDNSSQDK